VDNKIWENELMKKKIALIGANGQLGTDMLKCNKSEDFFEVIALTHKDIEITDKNNLTKVLDNIKPDIILNASAYNRVEEAEIDPKAAFDVNATALQYLVKYSADRDIILTHISTDYVFGLDKERNTPYTELDIPGPVNTYGVSKIAGEYFVRQTTEKHFIIRTSGLYGIAQSSSKGYNFVELMLRLAEEEKEVRVVNDQISSPTYSIDLARQIFSIIKEAPFGLYHASAEGLCSHYEFAKEIFKITNQTVKLQAVSTKEFGAKAQRPAYSVLENVKLKKLGINKMRHWQEGLKDYLKEKGSTFD